jgi:REP element-mobilizing transposase RayT
MSADEKYKGKYRSASTRWASWDYGSNAAYFVTICVANRAHDFGEVSNGSMQLTPLGQSAQDCWQAIPEHFPFIKLGAFVVMPDHVHGVVIIDKPVGVVGSVGMQNFASQQSQQAPQPPKTTKNQFGPQSQNLASIIRGYKIGVTKFARQNNIPFEWQPLYHDHVIRNATEYERISAYIIANPQNCP